MYSATAHCIVSFSLYLMHNVAYTRSLSVPIFTFPFRSRLASLFSPGETNDRKSGLGSNVTSQETCACNQSLLAPEKFSNIQIFETKVSFKRTNLDWFPELLERKQRRYCLSGSNSESHTCLYWKLLAVIFLCSEIYDTAFNRNNTRPKFKVTVCALLLAQNPHNRSCY